MSDRVYKQGGKVIYTNANGAEHEARIDYIWATSDKPLINVSYADGDDRVVATSVPHRDAVPGASGYYYDLPEPKTIYIQIDADPGDYLVFQNRRNNYTTKIRVPEPPPNHNPEALPPPDLPWHELHAVGRK